MRSRRVPTGLSGIIAVDKPAGMTSHDVVAHIRRASSERRVGHAGTLDPMATGLLVVLVGPATRLAPYLTAATKRYAAGIIFGTEMDTDDADGTVTRTADVPEKLRDVAFAAETLADWVGEHDQVPPAYSAVKVDGQTAYSQARAGRPAELAPRTVTISALSLLAVNGGPPLAWDVELEVSKGTYVRALARDLGRSLETAAHLGSLRRLSSGPVSLFGAHALADVERVAAAGDLRSVFTDPLQALGLPALEIDATTAALVAVGRSLETAHAEAAPGAGVATSPPDGLVAITHAGTLLAVYALRNTSLVPRTVLPTPLATASVPSRETP